jgi:hypothetical protein
MFLTGTILNVAASFLPALVLAPLFLRVADVVRSALS